MSVQSGSIRFNTDSSRLEIYNGEAWWEIDATSPEQQTGGTRGLLMGGRTPSDVKMIDFININTTGDAQDFGDLASNRGGPQRGQAGSRVRGLAMGGNSTISTVASVTFASTGNATDTGNILTVGRRLGAGVSNQTRALYAGGLTPSAQNVIDATDIASLGNSVDFGDLTMTRYFQSGVSSPTRGVIAAGYNPSSPVSGYTKIVDFVTISTQGNAADFGQMTVAGQPDAAGNSIRGIFSGGVNPSYTNAIEFLTIATLGNATDFGDLTLAKAQSQAVSSPTRFVSMSGRNSSDSLIDEMDYVQIMSKGNAVGFGEIVGSDRLRAAGASNGHGGLG